MSKVHYTGKFHRQGFGGRVGIDRFRVAPYTDGSPRPVTLLGKDGKETPNIPEDVAQQIRSVNPSLFVIDGTPTKSTPKSKDGE